MVKTKKQRRIFFGKRETIYKIMSEVGCSYATVYNALRYGNHSEMAIKIRELALNKYGGKIITESKLVRED